MSTFMLSTKKGKEAYVEPVVEGREYRFTVKIGSPPDVGAAKRGTTAGRRSAFRCLMSGVPVTYDHVRSHGRQGGLGARLMAIVVEGDRSRIYLAPTPHHEAIARGVTVAWKPDLLLPDNPREFKTLSYGLPTFTDLFTPRQLVALTTFSDLVTEARGRVERDALDAATSGGQASDPLPADSSQDADAGRRSVHSGSPLRDGGEGPFRVCRRGCGVFGLVGQSYD